MKRRLAVSAVVALALAGLGSLAHRAEPRRAPVAVDHQLLPYGASGVTGTP